MKKIQVVEKNLHQKVGKMILLVVVHNIMIRPNLCHKRSQKTKSYQDKKIAIQLKWNSKLDYLFTET